MKALLFPLSLLYQTVCFLIDRLYRFGLLRPVRASLPVIAVGNITFGGSEKTPLAMELLKRLQKSGFRPALLTRGYKGKWEKAGGVLSDGKKMHAAWREAGDEPVMIARSFPKAGVFIGRDRLSMCREARKRGFNMAVLDDAFQYRQMEKNLEIVLHDPAGSSLRREFRSALNRCDLLLIKEGGKPALHTDSFRRKYSIPCFGYRVVPLYFHKFDDPTETPFESLANQRVLSVSGIARPERFTKTLEELNIHPVKKMFFPDHHSYPAKSRQKIRAQFERCRGEILITTEKDMIKLIDAAELQNIPAYFLKIGLKIDPEFDLVLRKYIEDLEEPSS